MLMPAATVATPARPRSPAGLSLVEMMVGIAVGLMVVAGGLTMSASSLGSSHRLLGEARFNQDMRVAMDLITRDLRRAGYWGNAISGTLAVGATSATVQNPYSGATGATADGLTYQFSRDATENNALDSNERFGFRVHENALQMTSDANGWRDVTDTTVMTVATDGLVITPTVTVVPLGDLCPRTCTAGTPNCPTTTLRNYAVSLTATARFDSTVVRTLTTVVRLRNDQLSGVCPA